MRLLLHIGGSGCHAGKNIWLHPCTHVKNASGAPGVVLDSSVKMRSSAWFLIDGGQDSKRYFVPGFDGVFSFPTHVFFLVNAGILLNVLSKSIWLELPVVARWSRSVVCCLVFNPDW